MKNTKSRRQFLGQAGMAGAAFFIVPRQVLGGTSATGVRYLAPSDKINLGFIGAGGKQGRILAKFFYDTAQVNIVAASEIYAAKAENFLTRVKALHTADKKEFDTASIAMYTDYRELLAQKKIDAVVIATPDHQHAAMAVRAAEAGKDIYCEKPMALTVKEGRAMVNAARKHKRVFQTGSMQRSWKEFRQAVELVRNGYIGDVKMVKVNVGPPPVIYNLPAEPLPDGLNWEAWLGPNSFEHFNAELAPPVSKDVYPNWRLYKPFGGGMVTDWGAHMFDIAQWALDMDNSGPVKLTPPNEAAQTPLTFEYANGIKMTHEKWEWNNAVHFIGTEGEVKIQRGKLETTPATLKDKVIGGNDKRVYFSANHYIDFLDAIRKRSKPICDVEVGHRTSSVCNIANICYAVNEPLQWDPKAERFDVAVANSMLGRYMNDKWGVPI